MRLIQPSAGSFKSLGLNDLGVWGASAQDRGETHGKEPAPEGTGKVSAIAVQSQTRSMIIAGAIPPPVHMVISPVFRSLRSSSSSMVPISMEPVAAIG